jgi:hypothetical protein
MEDRNYLEQRARLADEAAVIVGQARAEAAEIRRQAQVDAAAIVDAAQQRSVATTDESTVAADRARREIVQAQERALAIRSEATQNADAIVARATLRARAASDQLLRDAQRRLARALDVRAREGDTGRLVIEIDNAAVDLDDTELDELLSTAVREALRDVRH